VFFKPLDPRNWVSPDTENWSFWSSPYPFENPGVDVVSPSPRKYFQIAVDFSSTIEDGSQIDYIEFRASVPPAVRSLVGEIFPVETQVGEPTHFTYYIKPTIRSGDSSFDGVEISTPARVVSVDSLRIDGVDQQDFSWRIHGNGLGFEVMLPRKLEPTDSGALLEVVFNAPVLREVGTQFEGRVFDTSKPNEVRQRVIPGNAADEIESDQLSVNTSMSSALVFAPQVVPNPFTPNGDGVNDVVNISYKLLRLTSAVPVSVGIFDLSGRLVKRVYSGEEPLGEYSHLWDGTDSSNRLVPPGLYLYRIVVDVHSGQETENGILSVAY
jgi:gliding motility-associated-like protein